jgi:hypothetical protein
LMVCLSLSCFFFVLGDGWDWMSVAEESLSRACMQHVLRIIMSRRIMPCSGTNKRDDVVGSSKPRLTAVLRRCVFKQHGCHRSYSSQKPH